MAGQSFLDMYMNKKLGKVVTVNDVYEINSKIPWMFFQKKTLHKTWCSIHALAHFILSFFVIS